MSEEMNIQDFATFLEQTAALEQDLLRSRIVGEKKAFDDLMQLFDPVDRKYQVRLETTAPSYNVFDVLNIRHYETKVHTPFLVHLLNPRASHKQGRLFLDSFFKHLLGADFDVGAMDSIQLFEEYSFGNGRIDILILYKMNDQNMAMAIENKIYAADQEKQLERYYNYMIDDRKIAKDHCHLIYLKPKKGPPSMPPSNPYSITQDLYDQLIEEKVLLEIGYHENIAPWLEFVVDQVKAPNIYQTIRQYIKTIKTL